jgi:hypothetical protein
MTTTRNVACGKTMRQWRWLVLPSLLAVSSMLHAQELPTRWMDWVVQPVDSTCAGDKALAAQMVPQLKTIIWTFLKANPDYPAKGYAQARLIPVREVAHLSKSECESHPLGAYVGVLVSGENQLVFGAGGKGRPTGRRYDTEGGIGGFYIEVNRIPTPGSIEVLSTVRDEKPPIWVLPQLPTTSTFQGYAVLDHKMIVITPPGYPAVYVPVTIEQAIKQVLPSIEKEAADAVTFAKEEVARMAEGGEFVKSMKAAGASSKQLQDLRSEITKTTDEQVRRTRGRLDLLKGRLAKLTPATKGAPAYWKDELPQAEAGDGAQALVTPNPDYFNKHLPMFTPQLLVITSFDDTQLDRPEPVGDWKAMQKVDWKALAKELLH